MTTATLLSIQVGAPTHYDANGENKAWHSGIFKHRVDGAVRLNALNIDGDGQADLRAHGGPYRAVLGYAAAHYLDWRIALRMPDLPYGAFGENFTMSDLTEESVCLGDVYRVGDEVEIQVSQPRNPCWKLNRRWGMEGLEVQVHEQNRGGWYHRVLREGIVEAGMEVALIDRPYPKYKIADVVALYRGWMEDREACGELMRIEALSPEWRQRFGNLATKAAV